MASAIVKKKLVKKKLVRKYGFFECTKCKKLWQSAHVYCDRVTLEVKYKQSCKVCETFYDPYKIEDIKCSECGLVKVKCKCDRAQPDDATRPHRSDLCQKCLSGDPCTTTHYPTAGIYWEDDDRNSDQDDHSDSDDDSHNDFDNDPFNFDNFGAAFDEDEYNYYNDDNENHNDYDEEDDD